MRAALQVEQGTGGQGIEPGVEGHGIAGDSGRIEPKRAIQTQPGHRPGAFWGACYHEWS